MIETRTFNLHLPGDIKELIRFEAELQRYLKLGGEPPRLYASKR